MNLPNKLTIGRLVLTVIFVTVLSLPIPGKYWYGLFLFLLASWTDYLDGHIARRDNLVTSFGKITDSIADKVLLSAAFVVLCREHMIPAWFVILVLMREFSVTGLRMVAVEKGVVISAEKLGKHKMVWQILASIWFFVILALRESQVALEGNPFWWDFVGWILLIVTGALTVLSAASYIWKNRQLLLASA